MSEVLESTNTPSAAAIFVKTPGWSAIKTRLAKTLGSAFGHAFHWRSAMAVAEVVRNSGLRGYWAVAELEAVTARAWTGFPNLVQPQGSLGLRLWAINKTLIARHGGCVVMGADAPGLTVAHLLEADCWLRAAEPRLVVGPARDGGFWLFGSNRNLTRRFWAPLRFDPNDRLGSFTAFRSALEDLGAVLDLPLLADLDQDHDLSAVIEDLTALEQPLPAQRELLEWLRAQQQRLART